MNRVEKDASAEPELGADAKQFEQYYAQFAFTSCFLHFCLAFVFAPLKYTKITRILQNRVVLALNIWRVFMISETRLVILLPLETKLVALDNTVKLSCAFVQY